jgi:hypothetical protein
VFTVGCAVCVRRYGYRRVTRELSRNGIVVNHKRVLRLMRDLHTSFGLAGAGLKPAPSRQMLGRKFADARIRMPA